MTLKPAPVFAGRRHALFACAIALGIIIFCVESLGRATVDFPALYVLPVLVASVSRKREPVIAAAAATIGLILTGFCLRAATGEPGWGAILASVSLAVLGAATFIVLRGIRQRRSDTEHRLSEARYHGMFQTMGVAYWEMDFSQVKARCDALWRSGVRDFAAYVRANPGFVRECIELSIPRDVNAASVRLFGAEDAGELMAHFGKCWPVDSEGVFGGAMLAALRNAPVFETEAVLCGVDGRRVEALFTVSYPPGSEARDSIVVALLDLSESNRAKEQLRAAQDDLAHAMRLNSLGILTATIAHEVNQPLGGVIANSRAGLRWLQRETPDLAEVANSIEQALSEAKRAAEVLSRIRATARKAEPEPAPLDLNELVEETMVLLAGELRNNRVALGMDLRPGPSVVADRIQLQQVIINLALNSIHAMRDIEGRPRVLSVSTSWEDVFVTVSVDDTGHGIEPELAGRLFTPFFTTKGQGLGIGLSVCGNIIERLGGRIFCVPKDSPGFRVQFTLPLSAT